MVGAALACALADLPLRIAVFDRARFDADRLPCRATDLSFDNRVSAIAPASRDFLDTIGAWDTVMATRVSPYTGMHVWDADGTGSIQFSAADIHQPCLGYIVENSVILLGLHRRLQQLDNVTLISPIAINGLRRIADNPAGSIELAAEDGSRWQAKLLLGADGPMSRVRSLGNFTTREWDYRHQAVVTTVRTELPHQATALQRFMPTGPLAFLPLHDGSDISGAAQHYCSIVWSSVPEQTETMLAEDDRQFSRRLAAGIEHHLGEVEWVDRRIAFPLRQRHAVNYVQPNVALLGDAAHTIHPLAGQGVNLGFMDARELAQEIGSAVKAGRPPGDYAVLRRYERARKGHNLGMMGIMEGFKLLFAQDSLPLRWLRNTGMSQVNRAGFIKNRLMRRAMGL